MIRGYAQQFGADTLVETGTFLGDMVSDVLPQFRAIYSIELQPLLWERAVRRFKRHKHVTILRGDSAEVLPAVLPRLHSPTVFWLDGHYSGGLTARGNAVTPIQRELQHVLQSRHGFDDVILIDDARLFTGQDGYPTLADVRAYVEAQRDSWQVLVESDIIRCHAGPTSG